MKNPNIDSITDKISAKIKEGSNVLNALGLRMEICEIIRLNHLAKDHEIQEFQKSPEKLMTELTKFLISVWPARPPIGFQEIEERLKPMKDIAAILNSKEISEFVRVGDNPCVMKDSRMAPEEFQKQLLEGLFCS